MLAPAAGTSPRYSIPFFQNIAQDLRLSGHVLQCASSSLPPYSLLGIRVDLVPPEVLELKERRGQLGQTDCESGLLETLA